MWRKLKAIWKIICADKFAVFEYINAPNSDEVTYPAYFSWIISDDEKYFIDLIKNVIVKIEGKTW